MVDSGLQDQCFHFELSTALELKEIILQSIYNPKFTHFPYLIVSKYVLWVLRRTVILDSSFELQY